MKNLFFFFIAVVVFSCSTPKDRYDLISEKQMEQLKNGTISNTTILNFKFGMSDSEVDNHLSELLRNNEISTNNQDQYEFTIPLEVVTAKATFSPKYFNDSLYCMTLRIEGENSTETELIQLKMVSLLMTKYGKPLILKNVLNENENDYIFIVGNQQIELNYPFMGSLLVNYSDFRMKQKSDEADRKQKEEQNKETIRNL